MLPVFQCLKCVISYFLSGFKVVLNERVNLVPVIHHGWRNLGFMYTIVTKLDILSFLLLLFCNVLSTYILGGFAVMVVS